MVALTLHMTESKVRMMLTYGTMHVVTQNWQVKYQANECWYEK